MKLDKTRPYGQTYGPDSASHTYMQDGVYFGPNGEHADCVYNRKHHPHLFVAPLPCSEPTGNQPPPENTKPPENPEGNGIAEELQAHTDAEVYVMAIRLRERLDESADPDKFVPEPADKALNIEFITRHVA